MMPTKTLDDIRDESLNIETAEEPDTDDITEIEDEENGDKVSLMDVFRPENRVMIVHQEVFTGKLEIAVNPVDVENGNFDKLMDKVMRYVQYYKEHIMNKDETKKDDKAGYK